MKSRKLFLFSGLPFLALLSACARETVSSDKIAVNETSPAPAASTPARGPGGAPLSSHSSDGIANNNIRRVYSFMYAEDGGRAAFLASFYLANTWTTTVKLAPPSQLLVNGSPVNGEELMSSNGAKLAGTLLPVFIPFFYLASGTHYFLNLPASGPNSTISVEWTDQVGQVFRDQMTMRKFSFSSPSKASLSSGFEISIADEDDGAEYSASLTPKDSLAPVSKNSRSTSSQRAKSKRIVFSPSDLSTCGSGRAELTVEKRTLVSLDLRGGNRGSGSAVYKAAVANVDISN